MRAPLSLACAATPDVADRRRCGCCVAPITCGHRLPAGVARCQSAKRRMTTHAPATRSGASRPYLIGRGIIDVYTCAASRNPSPTQPCLARRWGPKTLLPGKPSTTAWWLDQFRIENILGFPSENVIHSMGSKRAVEFANLIQVAGMRRGGSFFGVTPFV